MNRYLPNLRTSGKFCRALLAIASVGLSTASLKAGTAMDSAALVPTDDAKSFMDWLWGLPVLVDDADASILQKLAITGRYHGQGYALSSDSGSAEDWDNRRLWLGGDMTVLKNLRIKADVVFDANDGLDYASLYEAFVAYKFSDAATFSFGRREPILTQEFMSSKHILTFERSLLVNQLHPENLAGWWVNGTFGGGWQYDVGFYSGELDQEFGSFDAGWVYMASIGYDFAKEGDSSAEKSLLRFDYMANDGADGNNKAKPYEHTFSLNYTGDYGRIGMITDVLYATGLDATPDVWGIVLMPTYDITDKLQAVFRYQWANSNGDNGLTLQRRYERAAPELTGSAGDAYHAFYGGLNYRIYGDKLKLMTGVEYSTMEDDAADGGEFDGWTGLAGIRMYF